VPWTTTSPSIAIAAAGGLLVVVVRALIRAMISLSAIGPVTSRTVHHDVEAKSAGEKTLKNRPVVCSPAIIMCAATTCTFHPDTACQPSIVR